MNRKSYFNEIAKQWDSMREGFFNERVREKALDVACVKKGKLAADIGAGTGFMTEGLVQRGLGVIAVDQSKLMLKILKSKLAFPDKVKCRVGEADNLPIEDDQVDYVFANMYLHHVEHPYKAIREMVRILKPDGMLVITDLDEHEFEFLKFEQHDRWLGFKRENIINWFEKAGLNNVNVDCVEENCCSKSEGSDELASISIFVASGEK